jgi:hypothetical protein
MTLPKRREPAAPILPIPIAMLVRAASLLTWDELPRVILSSVPSLAFAGAVLMLMASGHVLLAALAAFGPALMVTGLARYAASCARGEHPAVRVAVSPELSFGLSLGVVCCAVISLLNSGGFLTVGGEALAAALALLAPYALVYDVVRQPGWFSSWRGAFILVAVRPSWGLTMLGLGCIGSFAAAATLGVLAVVIAPGMLILASLIVMQLVTELDGHAPIPSHRAIRTTPELGSRP